MTRQRRSSALTPSELAWLTGSPQPGANRFWIHGGGAEKVARCRELIALHPHLIPAGRLAALEKDLQHWSPRQRRANGGGQ